MKYRKIIILLFIICLTNLAFSQTSFSVISPDKTLKMNIINRNHKLCYSIEKNYQPIIEQSGLLWFVNNLRLGDSITDIKEIKKTSGNSSYTARGVHSMAKNYYNSILYYSATKWLYFQVLQMLLNRLHPIVI